MGVSSISNWLSDDSIAVSLSTSLSASTGMISSDVIPSRLSSGRCSSDVSFSGSAMPVSLAGSSSAGMLSEELLFSVVSSTGTPVSFVSVGVVSFTTCSVGSNSSGNVSFVSSVSAESCRISSSCFTASVVSVSSRIVFGGSFSATARIGRG